MLPVLVATLLDAYREMRVGARRRARAARAPRLALVDVPGSPSIPEFRIICAAAGEAGLEAIHVTTDELSYDGSVLRAGGEPVHLVYRRALVDDLSEGDLTAAYRDGAACVVNPPRARVANNKKLIALLDDPRFAHLVEPREAEVIARHDPLDPGAAAGPRHLRAVDDRPARLRLRQPRAAGPEARVRVRRPRRRAGDRDRAGRLGPRSSPSRPRRGDFIVQEYVPVPEEMFPTVEDGHVQMRLKRFNINPFGIGGRYAGMITRISDQAVDQRLGRRRPAAERGRPPQAAFAGRAGRGSGGGVER